VEPNKMMFKLFKELIMSYCYKWSEEERMF